MASHLGQGNRRISSSRRHSAMKNVFQQRRPSGSAPVVPFPEDDTELTARPKLRHDTVLFDDEDEALFSTGSKGKPSTDMSDRVSAQAIALIQNMATHCLKPEMSDITITVDGETFPCHRILLSCTCNYFKEKFEGNPKITTINLPGKSARAVKSLLQIMYCERTPTEAVRDDLLHLVDVLELAEDWHLKAVVQEIQEYVHQELTTVEKLSELLSNLRGSWVMQNLRKLCGARLRKLSEKTVAESHFVAGEHELKQRQGSEGQYSADIAAGRWIAPMRYPKPISW